MYSLFHLGILVGSSIFSVVIGIVSFAAITQLGCPPLKFYGIDSKVSESIAFNIQKCINQGCSSEEYEPICSIDGETNFFSPCQAGCQSCKMKSFEQKKKKKIKFYSKCSCVAANSP